MKCGYALVVLLAICVVGWLSGTALAVSVPYLAALVFLGGLCYRVARWAIPPVPFRIPTTCGQQRSLSWIQHSRLGNPATGWWAAGRMVCEILFFRSLFRNTRAELNENKFVFGESKWLWLAALAFHWSLLIILLRHLRLFLLPVPGWVLSLQQVDGFFQIGVPELYLSDVIVTVALAYLLARRLRNPQVRFMSLFSDYFALLLLLAIAVTGVCMRYFYKVDTATVKQFALGLVTFSPSIPRQIGSLFYVHLALVSALAVYFPFSKLAHMGGVFLSPTRNLANNSRAKRHVNPWNYPVHTHTYAEWEEEFRDKLVAANLPIEAEHVATVSTD